MFSRLTSFEDNLFDELRHVQSEWDDLFGRLSWPTNIRSVRRGTFPPVNIGVTPEKVDVYLFAAGLDAGTLDISIQRNLLTVSGERIVAVDENADHYRKERYSGAFRRVITLPEDADPDRVQARYVDGVLHVTVNRREATRPRQIEVQ